MHKVVSFFPRRKMGEESDGRLPRQISVRYIDVECLFHLPLKDAARAIKLGATSFKKACRSFGMKEWPFRRHAGPASPVFSSASPQDLLQLATRSFSAPLDTAPPRELSCIEAVMDYLEGPLVGSFEFMFVDGEGAPEVSAWLDGNGNGAE